MLKATLFLMSLVLSVGLFMALGFAAVTGCFGLCLLTVVLSSQGVESSDVASQSGTRPTTLAG
ncbi:hypothetical protein WKW79_35350 [Variovorax robiniae]|uniref:DUF2892 domain-containing protein n=1 Tax=Variovorax robiniae TaxID=1836199 RepID=A0ABU8XJ36_9BURK